MLRFYCGSIVVSLVDEDCVAVGDRRNSPVLVGADGEAEGDVTGASVRANIDDVTGVAVCDIEGISVGTSEDCGVSEQALHDFGHNSRTSVEFTSEPHPEKESLFPMITPQKKSE